MYGREYPTGSLSESWHSSSVTFRILSSVLYIYIFVVDMVINITWMYQVLSVVSYLKSMVTIFKRMWFVVCKNRFITCKGIYEYQTWAYKIIACVFNLCILFVGAVYRHFESRRRIYNDSQPSRLAAKKTNEKRNKIRSRQRQVQCSMLYFLNYSSYMSIMSSLVMELFCY